jgi:hypothetical protein
VLVLPAACSQLPDSAIIQVRGISHRATTQLHIPLTSPIRPSGQSETNLRSSIARFLFPLYSLEVGRSSALSAERLEYLSHYSNIHTYVLYPFATRSFLRPSQPIGFRIHHILDTDLILFLNSFTLHYQSYTIVALNDYTSD